VLSETLDGNMVNGISFVSLIWTAFTIVMFLFSTQDEVVSGQHIYYWQMITGQCIYKNIFVQWAGPDAARSKARTVSGHLNTGIVGSNPTRGMDVCLRFSVLCCPGCS